MSDEGRILIAITAIVGGVFAILVGVAMIATYAGCGSQASKMELEYSWGPLQDCMVRVDGKWMLLDSYKVVRLRPQ